MTYIRKLLFICCSLLLSNTVYAECIDTPAEIKAQDRVLIQCKSQEENLGMEIYTSVSGDIVVSLLALPLSSCDIRYEITNTPSKVINGKAIRMKRFCGKWYEDTRSYDVPETIAGRDYIKKQILKNKPLVVTSPNKDNPFKATFDTHKYREMILDAFNTNDGIRNGI